MNNGTKTQKLPRKDIKEELLKFIERETIRPK